MNKAGSDIALTAWRAPECPFAIEYSQRVFDDIRLAIIDAFCSLPRGGAEIGGLLMGEWRPGCLRITAYAPLDCEHAHGPSFTLSANDESRLRELIAKSPADFPGLVPVGWYHSHTRSEIFLSDADLSIHDRFFSETWQIALVLRPHMMQPTRAGFFFREASGDIHASEPYEEFSIEAKPMRPVPAGSLVEMPRLESEPHLLRLDRNPAKGPVAEARQITPFPSPEPAREDPASVVEMPAEPVAQAIAAPPAVAVPPEFALMPHAIVEVPVARIPENESVVAEVQVAPPSFLSVQEAPSRNWMPVITIAFVLVAMGTIGYVTQRAWLPKVTAAARPAPTVAPVPPAQRRQVVHPPTLARVVGGPERLALALVTPLGGIWRQWHDEVIRARCTAHHLGPPAELPLGEHRGERGMNRNVLDRVRLRRLLADTRAVRLRHQELAERAHRQNHCCGTLDAARRSHQRRLPR